MQPGYDVDKIKFSTDAPTFERALGLYEQGKVTKFAATAGGFSALVIGSQPYAVFVSARQYDEGNCACYLGQQDILCKHMVAVALWAVAGGAALPDEDKRVVEVPSYSGRSGVLGEEELAVVKKSITAYLRYIKSYTGPSRIWFAYQHELQEGCRRLAALVSELPVSEQTARVLVGLLLRLDRKLAESGVDDSDGTVGNFMFATVNVLRQYAEMDPNCLQVFSVLAGRQTMFDWEAPLVKLIDEGE